ncbi:MAG: hypothetical protein QNJ72_37725 [Pleurocapsa sp. MO_226.B13]|nr:hypothetical protein [Pleurocapsa sp. MO_226.B13]
MSGSQLGDYPWEKVPYLYNLWAQKNGFVDRTIEQIENKIIRHKKSRRLDCSSEYLTTTDLSFLLGCDRHTSARFFKTYRQELKPQGEFKKGSGAYVSRRSLKKWLINHQNVVERYRSTMDLIWYTDIISS